MAGAIQFVDLCKVCDRIYQAHKDRKLKIITGFLDYCRELGKTAKNSGFTTDTTVYPIFRLLLPKLDESERGAYGIRETVLARIYIRILCLPKDGIDALKLLKFRSPTAGSSAGDFADVAYWVLKNRCRNGGTLSVDNVNQHLDNIASAHAGDKTRGIEEELTTMLLSMSAEEQKWLIRMLLKDTRLGLGLSNMFNALHPDAKDLYDVCNNLRKVCETLQDPEKRLHEIEVTLFEPCRPMLSFELNVLKVDSVLQGVPYYYIERKHDGERFQLHMKNRVFKYFSRSGKEYTDTYGGSSRDGLLTPQLSKQLHSSVVSCILDGEMMGWNQKLQCFGSKGMKFDVKTLKEGNLHRPCFCAFDILLLNGEVLTNKTYEERVQILTQIFTPLEGVFMNTSQIRASSSTEVVKALNDAIDKQEEGLIIKLPNSVYKPATRKGGWYKIKPEYTGDLVTELDLLIIGGYYGGGRRRANISHFLLGIAVETQNEGEEPTEFRSMCRVGSGYTDEELGELLHKLTPHWRPVKPGQMPPGVVWTKERPDVWIQPKNSQILQVKATEIVSSDLYHPGYTLRFPRVEKVRYDKSWIECCTTKQFEDIRKINGGKLALKHVNPDMDAGTSPRKRQRTRPAASLGEDFKPADVTDVKQMSSRFVGKEFCVLSGNDTFTKQDLEKRIVENGGTVVQHRGSETFCAIAGKQDFRFHNLSKQGGIDIASVDWLIRVMDRDTDLSWAPHDLLSMSLKTSQDMELKYDNFHDSYHHHTTLQSLKHSLQKVSDEKAALNLLPSEMADLDIELFSGENPFAIFRSCMAYFFLPEKDAGARECELLKHMFRFQGGRISDALVDSVTHVLLHCEDLENYQQIKEQNKKRLKKFHIVSHDWVKSSWAERCRMKESQFYPKRK